VRGREDEPRDEVLGAAELEAVRPPDREVRLFARLERADVVAAEHLRAAPCRESERLPRRHRLAAAPPARDEKRLLDLHEQVAPLVRRGAVDAEPDADSRVEQRPHGSDAGAEAQIRGGAVRDARARLGKACDLRLREVDAVRAPHVVAEPAEPVEVLDRAAAVQLAAVGLFLHRLREVRVESQPKVPGELRGLLHEDTRGRKR
jgi:hypothetical protein